MEEEVFDEKSGVIIKSKRNTPRLKAGAIPTIFPKEYPSYQKSTEGESPRISPMEKKANKDAQNLQEALQQSLETYEVYQKERCFSTLAELKECLQSFSLSNFWNVIYHDNNIIFLNLKIESSVCLFYSVCINDKLELSVSYKGESLGFFNRYKFPMTLNNVNDLFDILNSIENNQKEAKIEPQVDIILCMLSNLSEIVEDEKKPSLEFLKEQLKLLFTKPEKYKYSPETLIFSSMFILISNSAYKFVRQHGLIILPHPSTLHRLSAKFNLNPLNEMDDENFLAYARQRTKNLQSKELYVSLMLDEIHIKEFFDYKGGNIVGSAHDGTECATSAHVFMLQSLFSKFKDVVYILPVKKISSDILFSFLKKIIESLEAFGYKVVVVVTDNNSINRKCMKNFNNPLAEYVYPHPCCLLKKRPLFYCIDPVHLIKSVRNNWINQKNNEQAIYFPSFEDSSEVFTASFLSVKKLYELESGKLLKHGYSLSQKALWPSSLEKQNVKLALQVINDIVSKSLISFGKKHGIVNYKGTSIFIQLFHRWFSIMNVKTPNKGLRFKENLYNPLTNTETDDNFIFLHNFLNWLEKWEALESDTGRFSRETFSALLITTNCIISLVNYISDELHMDYLLPGKIQTDELEYRFSLYRRMGGTQYHISMRQILEIEKKLRTCNVLKLALKSNSKENVIINEFVREEHDVDDSFILNEPFLSISVSDDDIENIQDDVAVLTFLAGYCVHSVVHLKLKCNICLENLTFDKDLAIDPHFQIISDFDRGGLKYPSADIINIVTYNFIIVKKLVSDLEMAFLKVNNQKQIAMKTTLNVLSEKDIFIDTCVDHSPITVMSSIISASTNTLLNNYSKAKCDAVSKQSYQTKEKKSNKRKLATFSK